MMGYLAFLFPLFFLAFIGWLFIAEIVPQIQRAVGA